MKTTLADLAVGGQGVVDGFAPGSGPYRQRLLAMGLTRGTRFEVCRKAPLGDPVEIRLRNYHLSLRRDEARALQVQEVQP
ncbi:MAG: FeoA family protein [Desulfobulbus sp.]|jgi:ferrous iron transport protein A|nr:FeoA family protein [Desulfobulbus sp.]